MALHSIPPFASIIGTAIGTVRHGVRGHVRVLVVDDSDVMRRMIVGGLAGMTGIKVIGEATSAAEGILLATTMRPNVVILDIDMPGGSGLDMLAHVKEKTRGVMVIMFSGIKDDLVRKQCRQMGADHYFVKPEEFPALVGVLTQRAQQMGWEQSKPE